ncbi:unnamed protein product [Discula destructiva]
MHIIDFSTLAIASLTLQGVAGAPAILPALPTLPRLAALPPSTATTTPPQVASAASSVLASLLKVTPTAAPPTNAQQLNARLQVIYTARYTNLAAPIAQQAAAGLVSPSQGASLGSVVNGLLGANPLLPLGENSIANINLRNPASPVYPRKRPNDAPYSLTEAQLRAAIYIPPGFTYGQKPPTIFVPGTGSYGGSAFGPNLRKLLTNKPYADPVWLNIPGASLGDIQVNSQYVAYAINYISGISQNSNVSAISWSQGGLNVQWAFTYWPSTRAVVADFIPVAGDFHGTINANLLCLSAGGAGAPQAPYCAPAFQQQQYTSALITAFRARGGGNAYVPTTSLFSGFFDEIVQPQTGTAASAFLQGPASLVTNNEYQVVCPPGSGGASFYGHATSLYNPLGYALVVDALTHDGPGLASRLNLAGVCAAFSAPGLTIADNLATAALIPGAFILDLLYNPKTLTEPPLQPYVTQ